MKKDLQALEQKRKDVADLRHIWITKRWPFMASGLERLAFIDDTSANTNMAKTTAGRLAGSVSSTTRGSGAGERRRSLGPCDTTGSTRLG